jgi:hypothetical protein
MLLPKRNGTEGRGRWKEGTAWQGTRDETKDHKYSWRQQKGRHGRKGGKDGRGEGGKGPIYLLAYTRQK